MKQLLRRGSAALCYLYQSCLSRVGRKGEMTQSWCGFLMRKHSERIALKNRKIRQRIALKRFILITETRD